MHIIDTKLQNIRPAKTSVEMVGHVVFLIDAGSDQQHEIARFDCRCAIPVGQTPAGRLAQIKNALINDAMRQLRRMSELRSTLGSLAILPVRSYAA